MMITSEIITAYNLYQKGYSANKIGNVLDIAKFLYKDATLYLDRKRKVYETMLTIPRGRIKSSL